MSTKEEDEFWMRKALHLAKRASARDEVPVGAVVVLNNQIIGYGYNLRESRQTPLAHAEMLAIHRASKRQNNWRLTDCTLYVTLEPCVMCAGAILQSRIPRLVFGASDPKGGAMTSLYQLGQDSRLNHQVQCTGGVLETVSSELLRNFFKLKRKEKNRQN